VTILAAAVGEPFVELEKVVLMMLEVYLGTGKLTGMPAVSLRPGILRSGIGWATGLAWPPAGAPL